MNTRFSKQTGCFYPLTENYPSLPDDIIEVPFEDYEAAMARKPGDTLDVINGRVVVVLKPEATLLELRAQTWGEIKVERDRRSEAGCLVAGNWFHNDLKSRTQWERMANRATTLEDADPYLVDGEQVAWKTMSGAFVPLTAGLIRQVVDAFEVQEVATFKAAETHRAKMDAAADPVAYDYSSGWPDIFDVV